MEYLGDLKKCLLESLPTVWAGPCARLVKYLFLWHFQNKDSELSQVEIRLEEFACIHTLQSIRLLC